MAPKVAFSLKKLLERAKNKLPQRSRKAGAIPTPEHVGGVEGNGCDKPKIVNLEKRSPAMAPRVTLSGPLLIALSLVLVCAVAWAFFMGLMVGRGQDPQKSLPSMAGLLDADGAPREQENISENGAEAAQKPDLQGPTGILPLPTPQGGVHAPPTGNAAKAWPDANGASTRQKTLQPKQAPAKPLVGSDANQKYDFVYQAAAFRSNADASRAQKAINGKGLRATVRRSGKVYLLMVNFRGTQAEMDKMLGRLRSHGMNKPLRLDKTPVAPKPARQQRKR